MARAAKSSSAKRKPSPARKPASKSAAKPKASGETFELRSLHLAFEKSRRFKANEKDLREVPDEVRQNMAFTFVSTMDEVLRKALLPAPEGIPADLARADGRGDGRVAGAGDLPPAREPGVPADTR